MGTLACVSGVQRGRRIGNSGTRETRGTREGGAGGKGTPERTDVIVFFSS